MARQVVEFSCNECKGFFYVNINMELAGDFVFICPKCGHEHPRTVKNEQIVGDALIELSKHGENQQVKRNGQKTDKNIDRIKVPLSAYSTESRVQGLKTVNEKRGGFLAELWARAVGSKAQG